MAFADVVNKVSKSIGKEVGNMVSSLPLEYLYMGYLVSRGNSIESINENGTTVRDLYMFTYVTYEPVILALMEDGLYKDIDTGFKYQKLQFYNLMSVHLERGMNIDQSKYPSYSKNECIGVFNLTPFASIVDKVVDDELNSKDITLKVGVKKKKAYTPVELKTIYKRYKGPDATSSIVKTFTVPPILKDQLDPIKTVYGLQGDFMMLYNGKTEEEIYNDMKQKAEQYTILKNQ